MLKTELLDLFKAWIAVSLMFTIANRSFATLPLMLMTVGIGFMLHELAHKYTAQRFKLNAIFHSDNRMLLMGLLLSITGFIFAAPGAVYTRGATRIQHGIIALAGPLTNIALAGIFALTPFTFGTTINAFLAVFNMIPFGPFDGAAVWQWNKLAWTLTVILGGLFLIL